MTYLNNQPHEFRVNRQGVQHHRWKVWGSPWSPEFENWAWNYRRGDEAREVHADIPGDIDILITHTPPYKLGKLDAIHDGTPVGCEELTRRLTAPAGSEEALRPMLHVFGHIHEARGVHLLKQPGKGGEGSTDETVLVNAALVEYDQESWNERRVCKCDLAEERKVGEMADILSCTRFAASFWLSMLCYSLLYRRLQVSILTAGDEAQRELCN